MRKMMRAMPDMRNPWQAIGILLLLIGSAMIWWNAGEINKIISGYIQGIIGDSWFVVGGVIIIGIALTTLGGIILWKKA